MQKTILEFKSLEEIKDTKEFYYDGDNNVFLSAANVNKFTNMVEELFAHDEKTIQSIYETTVHHFFAYDQSLYETRTIIDNKLIIDNSYDDFITTIELNENGELLVRIDL